MNIFEYVKGVAINKFLKATQYYVNKRRHLSYREACFLHWLIQPIGKMISKGVA